MLCNMTTEISHGHFLRKLSRIFCKNGNNSKKHDLDEKISFLPIEFKHKYYYSHCQQSFSSSARPLPILILRSI